MFFFALRLGAKRLRGLPFSSVAAKRRRAAKLLEKTSCLTVWRLMFGCKETYRKVLSCSVCLSWARRLSPVLPLRYFSRGGGLRVVCSGFLFFALSFRLSVVGARCVFGCLRSVVLASVVALRCGSCRSLGAVLLALVGFRRSRVAVRPFAASVVASRRCSSPSVGLVVLALSFVRVRLVLRSVVVVACRPSSVLCVGCSSCRGSPPFWCPFVRVGLVVGLGWCSARWLCPVGRLTPPEKISHIYF